jgi:hypothetical protein
MRDLEVWQALGATHVTVNTMGAASRSQEHLDVIQQFKEVVDAAPNPSRIRLRSVRTTDRDRPRPITVHMQTNDGRATAHGVGPDLWCEELRSPQPSTLVPAVPPSQKGSLPCDAVPDSDQWRLAVAVKQVRVSDLSGRQASEDQFAKLIVHEHPQYQGPITLDVLPEEIGELPESEKYVSIEVIQPGERSGQRALLSVDRFNKLASSGDMHAILLNAVAEQQPQRAEQPRRRGRGTKDGQATGKRKVEWGLPHRGRISPEEAAYVREHLDEVQKLRSERGVPLLDPADPRTKERYGL